MKKLLLALVPVALLAAACSSDPVQNYCENLINCSEDSDYASIDACVKDVSEMQKVFTGECLSSFNNMLDSCNYCSMGFSDALECTASSTAVAMCTMSAALGE